MSGSVFGKTINYLPKHATVSEACEWLKSETGEVYNLSRLLEHGLMPWFWLDYSEEYSTIFDGKIEGYLAPMVFAGDTQRLSADKDAALVNMTRTSSGKVIKINPPLNVDIDKLRFLDTDLRHLAETALISKDVQEALNVVEVKYSDIFLMDNWESTKALTYLAGLYLIDFYSEVGKTIISITTLNDCSYNSTDNKRITDEFINKYNRLQQIWESGSHSKSNPPNFYIDWAISKSIEISWLNDDVRKCFYVSTKDDVINQVMDKPLSARTENNYLRLIFTLANSIDGFNPNKPYEAAQLIIDETGTDISKQTIAGYISKAHDLDSKEKG